MITEQDLLQAIAECQGDRDPDARTCRNLASYYTILEHMYPIEPEHVEYSYAPEPTYESDSVIGQAIKSKGLQNTMPVVEELLDAVQTLNPRLYASFLRKLNM